MVRSRVIPCLLIDGKSLYKTIQFKKPRYLGDPINTIKLFNGKEVDEIIIINIEKSKKNKEIDYIFLKKIISECFMPVCYGGKIRDSKQVVELFRMGIDKLSFNSTLIENPSLITDTVSKYGAQSVVASIDVRNIKGKLIPYVNSGKTKLNMSILEYVNYVQSLGVGEILLTSISNEGMMLGYDINLLRLVTGISKIPIIINGGAGSFDDLKLGVDNGASAVAAGSLFSYYGKNRAVMVNYLEPKDFEIMWGNK